jgi:hypothetical protein
VADDSAPDSERLMPVFPFVSRQIGFSTEYETVLPSSVSYISVLFDATSGVDVAGISQFGSF